jgi:hypothetical protein
MSFADISCCLIRNPVIPYPTNCLRHNGHERNPERILPNGNDGIFDTEYAMPTFQRSIHEFYNVVNLHAVRVSANTEAGA